MAAIPRLKALPKPHEQAFIETARKIREKRLIKQEELPDLPKDLGEKALALFVAMTDFEETGFWQAYDALAEDAPQLHAWKNIIMTTAPPEDRSKEELDERFLTNQSGKCLLKLSTIEDIYNLPDVLPLIAGVLEAGSVSLLYSVSGTGKTFTGLDIALSISHGIPWQGRSVQQGTTWYINTERGLKKRLQAWYKEHETLVPTLDHFKIIPWPLDLRAYTQEVNAGQYVTLYRRDLRPDVSKGQRWKDAPGGTKDELYLADCLWLRKELPVVLCEDVFSALSVYQECGDLVNVVATDGAECGLLTRWIARLACMPLVMIALDADAAGDKYAAEWGKRLKNARRLRPLLKDANEILMESWDLREWVLSALKGVDDGFRCKEKQGPSDRLLCSVCGIDAETVSEGELFSFDELGRAFCLACWRKRQPMTYGRFQEIVY